MSHQNSHLENGTFRPTPEFINHHAVLPPFVDRNVRRDAWRVRTRLETLVDTDLQGASNGPEINADEYEAGLRFRRDFEIAEAGNVRSMLDQSVARSTNSDADPQSFKLNAIRDSRAALDAVGGEAGLFLMASVVLDLSWQSVGTTVRAAGIACSEKTAKLRTCDALRALAVHYDNVDGMERKRKRAQRTRAAFLDN